MVPGSKHAGAAAKKSNGTLPETNIAPENRWLEYDCFLLGWRIFRCYVSFGECILEFTRGKNKRGLTVPMRCQVTNENGDGKASLQEKL